jgi:hypothetical protein
MAAAAQAQRLAAAELTAAQAAEEVAAMTATAREATTEAAALRAEVGGRGRRAEADADGRVGRGVGGFDMDASEEEANVGELEAGRDGRDPDGIHDQ